MAGGGKKERRREAAIVALMEHASVQAAARQAGISERTLYRWLKDEDFVRDYRDARRRSMEQALGILARGSSAMAAAILRNTSSDAPRPVQVRAATNGLKLLMAGTELVDLEERISMLEEEVDDD